MKNILFIVGSLRQGSFNHEMAKKAERILEGKATVTYLDYKDIPMMNQDLETPTLPAVQAARDAVLAADAIWIFSPFVRTQVVGDFTGTTVNPEAWTTGELVLTDDAIAGLEKQAQALLEA